MFLLKILAAAFLVSLNFFTFLLVKFQKNDRDNDLIQGVASGDPEDIKHELPKPKAKDRQSAAKVLEAEAEKDKPEDKETEYSHILSEDAAADKTESGSTYGQNNPQSAAASGGAAHFAAKPESANDEFDDDEDDSLDADSPPPALNKKQKKDEKKKLVNKYGKKPVSDIKLLVCALLGGSLGIYLALFSFRYRLRDILMMVLVPTLLVLNIYIYFNLFTVWLIFPAEVAASLTQAATRFVSTLNFTKIR